MLVQEEAIAHSDRIVTPTFRDLEIVGTPRARDQRRTVLKALRVFRQNVAPGLSWGDPTEQRFADKPTYGSPEYMEVYGEYTVARDAFNDAANEELTQ